MNTEPKTSAFAGGPYLLVACFCENVVQRADQVLTLVNIIDRLNLTGQGTDVPLQMPPATWRANLVLILKAGRARGRYELEVIPEQPDGSSMPPMRMSVNFEGEDDRGIQIVSQVNITLNQEGLYWFNVMLAEAPLTRLPLRVVYTRISGGQVPRR